MKVSFLTLIALFIVQASFASTYKYCQTQYGELEFVLPLKSKHLFLAPHSLSSSQRQLASLKSGNKNDMSQWETIHFKKENNFQSWTQQNLAFKSDFKKYIEVYSQEGKSHTYSLTCNEI